MAVCLVTGGAGFLGSHLVEALVARGDRVRVLDNLSTGDLANLAKVRGQVEFVHGDLTDLEQVRDAMAEVELVFHQATPVRLPNATAANSFDVGTVHVLTAARESQVRRVVYASSLCVYGPSLGAPRSERHPTRPVSPYAQAKLTGEQDCAAFTRLYGMETVRLRYGNLFGPRQTASPGYGAFLRQTFLAVAAGWPLALPSDGMNPQELLYVQEAVRATLLAAETPRACGRVYNVGRGRPVAPREILGALKQLLGTPLEPPKSESVPVGEFDTLLDVSRAETELGFHPVSDLERELRECLGRPRKAGRVGPDGNRVGAALGEPEGSAPLSSLSSSRTRSTVEQRGA
jgi:UDP-glucose 4-epimerase